MMASKTSQDARKTVSPSFSFQLEAFLCLQTGLGHQRGRGLDKSVRDTYL